MTLWSVQYDFQQCIMLHIALGNNVATGYKVEWKVWSQIQMKKGLACSILPKVN